MFPKNTMDYWALPRFLLFWLIDSLTDRLTDWVWSAWVFSQAKMVWMGIFIWTFERGPQPGYRKGWVHWRLSKINHRQITKYPVEKCCEGLISLLDTFAVRMLKFETSNLSFLCGSLIKLESFFVFKWSTFLCSWVANINLKLIW